MALPKFLQPFLPSYDISKMDLHYPEDRQEIITQILNYGTKKDIFWLFRVYSLREVKAVISKPMRGCWLERPLSYWTKIFNIHMPKIIYETAILSLTPRPELMRKYFNYLKRKGKIPKRTLKIWREAEKIEKLTKK